MHQLPFTAFLNQAIGGPVTALLTALHVAPRHAEAPISDAFAMEILVAMVLLAFFVMVRARLSVDKPGALQHMMEMTHGFIEEQSHEIIGHHSEQFTPYLVTIALFILTANLIGVIPTMESPTGVPTVPLGCALATFLYYNFQGFRKQGVVGYIKHFLGPMPALAPLMLPIEVFSHLARILSLTVRLYANIFAGDMVTLVFFSLIPVGLPVVFMGLHIGVSLIQTFIFVLLTTIYLQGAVAEEH